MQYLDLSDASTRAGVRSEYGPDFLGESAIFDRELARNPNRQHELWPEGRVLSKAEDPYLSVQEFWVPKNSEILENRYPKAKNGLLLHVLLA